MGETLDTYRGVKFPGFGRVLSMICGRFLQDGESPDTAYQKGLAFLMDR